MSWRPTDPAGLCSLTCNHEDHSLGQLFTINSGEFLSDKNKGEERKIESKQQASGTQQS